MFVKHPAKLKKCVSWRVRYRHSHSTQLEIPKATLMMGDKIHKYVFLHWLRTVISVPYHLGWKHVRKRWPVWTGGMITVSKVCFSVHTGSWLLFEARLAKLWTRPLIEIVCMILKWGIKHFKGFSVVQCSCLTCFYLGGLHFWWHFSFCSFWVWMHLLWVTQQKHRSNECNVCGTQ